METARKSAGTLERRGAHTDKMSKTGRNAPSLLPLDIGKSTSKATHFADFVTPKRTAGELILEKTNSDTLSELLYEFRTADKLKRHGLSNRNKLLFCGPPGCGKSITAEVLANELKLDLLVVRIDSLISSYLGETASNIRAILETAEKHPCVLFFDEFDALARTRTDGASQGELRRVVNTLLMLIENFSGRGLLIAATNLENTIDEALWRRFDEVMLFDLPDSSSITQFLEFRTRNFRTSISMERRSRSLIGSSFADLERLCSLATKYAVLERRRKISKDDFDRAFANLERRRTIKERFS